MELRIAVAKSLGALGSRNETVVSTLQQLLYTEISDAMKAALEEGDTFPLNLLEREQEEYWERYKLRAHHKDQLKIQYAAAESLGRLAPSSQRAMKAASQALQHEDVGRGTTCSDEGPGTGGHRASDSSKCSAPVFTG